jgi:hypothetical protein
MVNLDIQPMRFINIARVLATILLHKNNTINYSKFLNIIVIYIYT